MSAPAAPYEIRFPVQQADIDLLGHFNNVVYLRWVQEVATAHWRAAATPEDQARLLWVVRRHEIDYKRSARAGDMIIARTWVGSAEPRAFRRYSEFRRESDRKVLASALTIWCPVDRGSLRPTDVGDSVISRFAIAMAD